MKNILVILVIGILFVSCNKNNVNNNDIIANEIDMLEEYLSIENHSSAIIYLDASVPINKILIYGNQSYIDNLSIENDNKNLRITNKSSITIKHNTEDSLVIRLNNNQLKKVLLAESGAIKSKDLILKNNLDLKITGAGDLNLDIDNKSTVVDLSGSGNIYLKGQSDDLKIKLSGAGEIDCENLKNIQSHIEIAGAGNVKVNSNQYINASIFGVGNLFYKKYDELTIHEKINGIGKVSSY